MGFFSMVGDAAVVVLSLTVALTLPPLLALSVVPPSLYPEPLRALRRWYAAEFDDYLLADPSGFFYTILWLELVFLPPVAAATLYSVLTRRPWAATGSLVVGFCVAVSSTAIVGDITSSGRASPRLVYYVGYFPVVFLGDIAMIRGLSLIPPRFV